MTEKQSSNGIREYAEGMKVEISRLEAVDVHIYGDQISDIEPYMEERHTIIAYNACGNSNTQVDLIDILKHVKENMPDLWESI